MKILQLSTSDIQGGAARAAYRIHTALKDIGIESRMWVQSRASDDYTVIGPGTFFEKAMGILRPTLDSLPARLYTKRQQGLFSAAMFPSCRLIRKINRSDADVVHLHWIAGGMLRIEDLARIKKPIVWTLHDMWAFTGGCHYDDGCGNYKGMCESCPVLASQKKFDLSTLNFKRKLKAYDQLPNVTIVGASRWLSDSAKKISLLKGKRIVTLPYPIDTNTFRPHVKSVARDILGLSSLKKMILFGAMNATSDPRKGFSVLLEALKKITSNDFEYAIFGAGRPQNKPDFTYPVHFLGQLYDDVSLRAVYSAADVMVVPSLQENLSNIIIESLACATPVVGFRIGGNPDMIDHKINGYLAKPFDPDDLARGIEWVLNHPTPSELSKNARQKVLDNFEASIVAHQYVELYREILE